VSNQGRSLTSSGSNRGDYRLVRRKAPSNEGAIDWLLDCPHKDFFVPHRRGVSVSVTQEFSAPISLGRLTLNILLSFAQFEREIISERTRDKFSAARRKRKWIGGWPLLGYNIDPKGGSLIVNVKEAAQVREMYRIAVSGSISGPGSNSQA
jgi:hypothetical protein